MLNKHVDITSQAVSNKTFNEKLLSGIKQATSNNYNCSSSITGLNVLCFRQLYQLQTAQHTV